MMKNLFPYALFFACLGFCTLQAQELCYYDEDACVEPYFPWPHKFYIGPEFYHVERTREGGTRQHGCICGGRFSYERIAPWSLYWGANGNYAAGTLKGRTSSGRVLKSEFIDWQVEGRFGFTFQNDSLLRPAFTPYFGVGYLSESNNYRAPSPVSVNFEIYFPYASLGFVSSVQFKPNFTAGFNFEMRAMYDPKCQVTKDPDFDDSCMLVGDRVNYRFEIPIVYEIPLWCRHFEFGLMPFFEIRQYGARENYPFDFLRTRVDIYGINIQFIFRI